ncbi:MAG: response regulator [Bacteroidales bacterium]|nr:response regulator [Bacteroidales bacterium]
MLRTLIIDDEAHIRDTLTKLLALCCPQVNVVGEASGVSVGISKIMELQPDLIFLDINLKDGTGYELLHALQPVGFKVIFISSFDKKAVQAFKLSSVAFMQKPFNPVELIEAIKQVENMEVNDFDLCLEALEENIREGGL